MYKSFVEPIWMAHTGPVEMKERPNDVTGCALVEVAKAKTERCCHNSQVHIPPERLVTVFFFPLLFRLSFSGPSGAEQTA